MAASARVIRNARLQYAVTAEDFARQLERQLSWWEEQPAANGDTLERYRTAITALRALSDAHVDDLPLRLFEQTPSAK